MTTFKIPSSQQTDTRVRPLESHKKSRNCDPPIQSSVTSIMRYAPQIVRSVSRYLARSLSPGRPCLAGVVHLYPFCNRNSQATQCRPSY